MAGGAGYTKQRRARPGGSAPPQWVAAAPLVATSAAAGGAARRLPGTFRIPHSGAAAMARPVTKTYFLTHCPARATGFAAAHAAAGRAAERAGARRLYQPSRAEAVPARRANAGARLPRRAAGCGGIAADRRAQAGIATVAALPAPGRSAAAGGRHYALRAAGDGHRRRIARRRGIVAPSGARMAVGGARRWRVRLWRAVGRRARWPDAGAAGAASSRAPRADLPVCYSSVLDDAPPPGCLAWSPLSAFRQLRPPLPAQPAAFVLAGGLALRQEDA